LFTKTKRGTWYLSAWRHTVSDCAFHAGDRVEHHDTAIEDAQGALDFYREVDVTRGIDDVDAVVDSRRWPWQRR